MSASTSPKESKEPTPNEARFFWSMIKNMKTSINANVNWDGVASDMGLKNGNTASVRFGQIKKKLGLDSTFGSPSTPRKREAGAIKTPSKSGKSTKSTSGAAKKPKFVLRTNKSGYADVFSGDTNGLEDDDEIGGYGGPLQLDFGVKTEVKVDGSAEKETTTAEPAAKRQKVMDAIKVKAKDKTYDSIDAILAEPEPEDDEFTDAAFYHNYTTAAEKKPEDKTYGYGNGDGAFEC